MKLEGKVALITGSGQGIGRQTALMMAGEGADIVLNARHPQLIEKVAEQVRARGRKVIAQCANITSYGEVKTMIDHATKELGKVDIIVNNAGHYEQLPFTQISREQWHNMVDVYLHGAFYTTKLLIEPMLKQKWGRIINIASVAGVTGYAQLTHYCAAKAALIGFTKALALEVAQHGVTVNAIAPGIVDTERLKGIPQEVIEAFKNATPMGRFASPDEVASLCIYLASDEGAFITGQVLGINGGLYV